MEVEPKNEHRAPIRELIRELTELIFVPFIERDDADMAPMEKDANTNIHSRVGNYCGMVQRNPMDAPWVVIGVTSSTQICAQLQ